MGPKDEDRSGDGDRDRDSFGCWTRPLLARPPATRCQSSSVGRCCSPVQPAGTGLSLALSPALSTALYSVLSLPCLSPQPCSWHCPRRCLWGRGDLQNLGTVRGAGGAVAGTVEGLQGWGLAGMRGICWGTWPAEDGSMGCWDSCFHSPLPAGALQYSTKTRSTRSSNGEGRRHGILNLSLGQTDMWQLSGAFAMAGGDGES